MLWVWVFVGLAVAACVVLGALALRLWRRVTTLGREVAAAGDRLAACAPGSRPAAGDWDDDWHDRRTA